MAGEKEFKRSEMCVIFPPVRRIGTCQGMTARWERERERRVAGEEVDQADKRPDFTRSAGDQWNQGGKRGPALANELAHTRSDGRD